MEEELISKTKIVELLSNTSGKEYGLFTDKLIVIEQGDQKIFLDKLCLEYLETIIGAKFRL